MHDKKPTSCVEAWDLADEYELARNQEIQEKSNQPQLKKQAVPGAQRKWYGYCKTTSHEKASSKQGSRRKLSLAVLVRRHLDETKGRELQSSALTASRRDTLLLVVLVR